MEPLTPDFGVQPRRRTSTGAWAPPNVQSAYTSSPGSFWHWESGRVTSVPANSPVLRAGLHRYSTATFFSQYPDTPHLLVVPFDARTRNVSGYGAGWLPITFIHERIRGNNNAREFYSSISATGDEDHIAAPGQGFWMPQLLHSWYNYRASTDSQPRTHAGLIGSIPILLALAVYSAPAANLMDAMNSLRPGAWLPHRHAYPSGRMFAQSTYACIYN